MRRNIYETGDTFRWRDRDKVPDSCLQDYDLEVAKLPERSGTVISASADTVCVLANDTKAIEFIPLWHDDSDTY